MNRLRLLFFLWIGLSCQLSAQSKTDSLPGTYKRKLKGVDDKTLCVQRIIISKKNKVEFQNDTLLKSGFFLRIKKGTWELKGDTLVVTYTHDYVMGNKVKMKTPRQERYIWRGATLRPLLGDPLLFINWGKKE
ncbi:MAG: hypothetical protein AB1458_03300 [Bacteroidota bacterium]